MPVAIMLKFDKAHPLAIEHGKPSRSRWYMPGSLLGYRRALSDAFWITDVRRSNSRCRRAPPILQIGIRHEQIRAVEILNGPDEEHVALVGAHKHGSPDSENGALVWLAQSIFAHCDFPVVARRTTVSESLCLNQILRRRLRFALTA